MNNVEMEVRRGEAPNATRSAALKRNARYGSSVRYAFVAVARDQAVDGVV